MLVSLSSSPRIYHLTNQKISANVSLRGYNNKQCAVISSVISYSYPKTGIRWDSRQVPGFVWKRIQPDMREAEKDYWTILDYDIHSHYSAWDIADCWGCLYSYLSKCRLFSAELNTLGIWFQVMRLELNWIHWRYSSDFKLWDLKSTKFGFKSPQLIWAGHSINGFRRPWCDEYLSREDNTFT